MLSRNDLVGSWAGLPVAWKEDWSFDEATYRSDLERACKAGVPGVYTGGSTGEFHAMEFDEWKAVSRATVEVCKACGTPVMLGVTSTYTLGSQRRAAYALELGADAVQLAVPFWLEIKANEITPFFRQVADACPGLAVTIYDTQRAKHSITIDEHRAIKEAVPAYLAVKANAGTVGSTPEGCEVLSEFINVWVNENKWAELGPHGAVGCASALVYMNPRIILEIQGHLLAKRWDEVKRWCQFLDDYHVGLAPFTERGFEDTAYDHLQGTVTGFLKMHPRSRGPYISATEEDVVAFRKWLEANAPEMLVL